MKVPLSWLKEFVDIQMGVDEVARLLTMLGLEVDAVTLVGLPDPYEKLAADAPHEFKISGLSWDPEKIVVASISEVLPHPNADRLVLCRLDDGRQEHVVLTGAPNLYPYKGQGVLPQPIKVAYARQGARLYDGHQPGQVLTTLKPAKIRGVESYSMVCSEKELGISEEHEGVIFLDANAPTGTPLAEYIGDAVFDISILPNMARNASILGVAREIAAATGQALRTPPRQPLAEGPAIQSKVSIQIQNPQLNPRFVLGLIQNVESRPSPYLVQLRLRLAGMRPINSVVDATNYVMLEVGQPLHAFDYDVLVARAAGKTPTIITRTAAPGERLTTLDGADRKLDTDTVLVCDTAGALSIAGIMGGQESEVSAATRNILLEGAAWNFINIRKTATTQKLMSEAAYRFSRGVHPSMCEWGINLGLERMRVWSGGVVDQGLIDVYPLPAKTPVIEISPADVRRILGISLSVAEITALLGRLEFTSEVHGETIRTSPPANRLDIGEGVIGQADVLEEIARIYGYDNIPGTRLEDRLPPQRRYASLEEEERIRDILVDAGLQEIVSYRLTSPEREARTWPDPTAVAEQAYVRLKNPITPERNALRRSLLASVLDTLEHNDRQAARLAFFEVGPIFIPSPEGELPGEPRRLAVAMRGPHEPSGWEPAKDQDNLDFFDVKGVVETLVGRLHLPEVRFEPAEDPRFHPGKAARVFSGTVELGLFGELHPLVRGHYDLRSDAPIQAVDLDLEAILPLIPDRWTLVPAPVFPPVLEDIAVVVADDMPAARVEEAIRQAGGKLLAEVRLFDVFQGGQVGPGSKSLAYNLVYQAPDRTLTDAEAAQVRGKIIRRLEQDLGAHLRS
ncbi:MAG TPA: phenylalanine--tRNA ligase subunit beta [Anaerolineaceae bacterium]